MVIATASGPTCNRQTGGIKSRLRDFRVLNVMGLGQVRGSDSKDEDFGESLGEEVLGSL